MNSESDLRAETTFDARTGVFSSKYFFKGIAAPAIPLSGKLVRRLSGLSLLEKDLEIALFWSETAEKLTRKYELPVRSSDDDEYRKSGDRQRFDVVKGLFVAALTFYGKCFTESGRGASASRDWLTTEQRVEHDFMMTYRHSFAAHSGRENLEAAASCFVFDTVSGVIVPTVATFRTQPDIVMKHSAEGSFPALIRVVLKEVRKRYKEVSHRVVDIGYRQEASFWKRAAQEGRSVNLDDLH